MVPFDEYRGALAVARVELSGEYVCRERCGDRGDGTGPVAS